jgi:hypothetical protein
MTLRADLIFRLPQSASELNSKARGDAVGFFWFIPDFRERR